MDNNKLTEAKVGDKIRIIEMDDMNGTDPSVHDYAGRVGIVNHKDSAGQLHGTWGGLALQPEHDRYEIINIES